MRDTRRTPKWVIAICAGARVEEAWLTLWLLLVLCAALSAWAGGWALQFAPQRWIVLAPVPLAALAACGLERLHPRIRGIVFSAILACGVVSLSVSALFFQGPLGHAPGGAFAYLHYECMSEHDAVLLERLPEGRIAVPPWSPIAFGEIIALRPGMRVLGGPGALNLGDQPFERVQAAVRAFFDPRTDAGSRAAIARAWTTCISRIRARSIRALRRFLKRSRGCA